MKITIPIILWGPSYTNTFLDVVLPSYLSELNIPLISRDHDITLEIYTSLHSNDLISISPTISRLKDYASVFIYPIIDEFLEDKDLNKWDIKGRVQSIAIRKAISEDSILILLNPDAILSHNCLKNTVAILLKGYRVINVLEFARVTSERAIPVLKRDFRGADGVTLNISPRSLVSLSINNIHPIGELFHLDRKNVCGWPSISYWRAGDDSILARSFHLHPHAIDFRECRSKIPDQLMTDDGGLIEFLGFDKNKIYTVTDSDEFVLCELSSISMDPLASIDIKTNNKINYIINWAKSSCIIEHLLNYNDNTFIFRGEKGIKDTYLQFKNFNNFTFYLRFKIYIIIFNKKLVQIGVKFGLKNIYYFFNKN